MADQKNYDGALESLFKGMDNFLTTKTVVGDAITFPDGTIILPLVDVSFGVAAGAFAEWIAGVWQRALAAGGGTASACRTAAVSFGSHWRGTVGYRAGLCRGFANGAGQSHGVFRLPLR